MGPDDLGETLPATPDAVPRGDRLPAGARIGRYVVERVLGAGGMGIVYAARDPELDRTIALKLLRGDDPDGTAHERIRREAQALARTDHPNVVAVYDVGDYGDGLFIAMELVDGGTLRDWQGGRAWSDVLAAYVAAGRGLAAAHARGLVHRDFKPDNVLVSRDGRIRVTDFGIARLERGNDDAPTGSDAALTADGAIIGTPGYMAPEQAAGAAVDARSDQFAWCVAMWEALYGARPFTGPTFAAIALAMQEHHLAIPTGTAVPDAIGRALLRGLAIEPDARWPTMPALLDAIAPPTPRRRARTLALVGAGVVLAIGAIVLVMLRATPSASSGASGAPPACAPATSRLAGAWDAARRAALAKRFATSTRTDVKASLDLATRDLDAYATVWGQQWNFACASADRTSDPLLYAQRINCLERSLVDLQGVGEAMLEVDPERFAASWKGALFETNATPLLDCVRVASIRAAPPAPVAADRAEITKLVVDLHRARIEWRAAFNLGFASTDAAMARLDAITARLDALGSPAAAEAAWWQASYSALRKPPNPAAVDRATALARKYRNDRWLANALALASTIALDHRDIPRARTLFAEASEALERAGGDPARFDLGGRLALAEGNYADGIARLRQFPEGADALDHATADQRSADVVRALFALGRGDDAIAEARRHIAHVDAIWRGDHWTSADAHESLALALAYTHEPAAALAEIQTTLATHARLGSIPERVYSPRLLALACFAILGRDADRDAMMQTLAKTGTDDDDPYAAAIELAPLWAYGLLPWASAHAKPSADLDDTTAFAAYFVGDLATAERVARRAPIALDSLDAAGDRFLVLAMIDAGARHSIAPHLAALARWRKTATPIQREIITEFEAMIAAAAGDWRRVRALLDGVPFPDFPVDGDHHARIDGLLGRALVETGEPTRAIRPLQRCLFSAISVLYSHKNANYLVADARFALARAMWGAGGDRATARALAAQALAQYTPFQQREQAAVRAWLAAHA